MKALGNESTKEEKYYSREFTRCQLSKENKGTCLGEFSPEAFWRTGSLQTHPGCGGWVVILFLLAAGVPVYKFKPCCPTYAGKRGAGSVLHSPACTVGWPLMVSLGTRVGALH